MARLSRRLPLILEPISWYCIAQRVLVTAVHFGLLRWCGLAPLHHDIEQLTDQTKRIGLVIEPPRREAQQLGSEIGIPRSIHRDVKSLERHAATDRLTPNGLIAARRKRLPRNPSMTFKLSPL